MLNDQVLLLNKGHMVYNGPLEAMMTSPLRAKVEIAFDEPGAARIAAGTLQSVVGIEDVTVEESTVLLDSELPLSQIVKELDGHVDHVSSIGHARPKLRDVLEQMLRPGQGEP